jgi:hypothetical protein
MIDTDRLRAIEALGPEQMFLKPISLDDVFTMYSALAPS